jgi:wyosine [tRNA(Phe)-imidazoG37] synthetase (radical SAM superfamily)
MAGFLFNEIVFGPVKSRRFGVSLGINLLPDTMKYCTFNCIYCECGLTLEDQDKKVKLFPTAEIMSALESRFAELKSKGLNPDNITFAGNGEPTIHPDFPSIIDKTIELRNKYFPEAKITVLSNATRLGKPSVLEALKRIDNNVLKLDAGSDRMFKLIDRPNTSHKLSDIIEMLKEFKGNLIIQTLFLRGKVNNEVIDNTSTEELNLWLEHVKDLRPKLVMLYSIDRETPEQNLEKISSKELEKIALKVRELDIMAEVYS